MATARGEITLFPRTAGASDKTKYGQTVTAYSAISAGSLCAFTENGLEALGAGVSFDTTQPVLYSPSAVSAGAETSDLYIYYCGADARTITGDNSLTVDSGATLYIRGTLNVQTGYMTLPASGTDWLVYEPDNTEYIYMAIGRANEGSGVHEFAFVNDNQLYVCDAHQEEQSGQTVTVYTLTRIEEWVQVLAQESAEVLADIDTVVRRYGGETSTITSWLKFGANQQGMPELVIGTSANDEDLQLTNSAINFRHGSDVVAKIESGGFVFERGKVNTSLQVGNYLIKDDGDGGFAIV